MWHPLVPGRATFNGEACDVLAVGYPNGRAKYTILTASGVEVGWVDAEMLDEPHGCSCGWPDHVGLIPEPDVEGSDR